MSFLVAFLVVVGIVIWLAIHDDPNNYFPSMSTPPLPRPPEDRKQHHEWFNPHDIYLNLGDYESCKKCGIVKNERNTLACTCPGRIMVVLRG